MRGNNGQIYRSGKPKIWSADRCASGRGLRSGQPRWHCRCECGTVKVVAGNNLRSGQVLSCGCLRNERLSRPLSPMDIPHSPLNGNIRTTPSIMPSSAVQTDQMVATTRISHASYSSRTSNAVLRSVFPRRRADWLWERQTTPRVLRLATTPFPYPHDLGAGWMSCSMTRWPGVSMRGA